MVFIDIMLFLPLVIIAVALLPRAFKTRKFYYYGLKVSFIFLFVFTAITPNPLVWGQQIQRRLDHRLIIAPTDPAVQALNNSANLWAYISSHYSGATPAIFQTWEIPDQVRRVFYYIDTLIDYEYDIDNNYVFDYVATPAEVLASGKDDCQGISCVLTSLLIYLGYNAYVCETPFHWYVRVYYYDETSHQSTFCDVYRSASNTDPFYIFNDIEAYFPQDIFTMINATFSYNYIGRKFAAIVNGSDGVLDLSVIGSSFPETSIPLWIAWGVIFGICLFLGLLVSIFLNIPHFKKMSFLRKLISTITFGIPSFFGCLTILFVPTTQFLPVTLLCIGIAVFAADIWGYFTTHPIIAKR